MRISDWSSDVCSSDLELHRGAEKYRSLFDSIEAGFCIIEMIFDDAGKPVDYRFIETNPAFARHTGLSDAVGKSMRSLVPGHEQHWFDIYGQVARTGEAVRFEDAAEALGGYWYDVYRSEEHTSELQSLMRISYAVFCLKKKTQKIKKK